MKRYYYDLHLHSCLSPCGDNDNTPNNIMGMASLCGLNIVALTDHNSCKNCPAFFQAANKHSIIPIAGMELTTSEDIHVVCLFENLDDAMAFDEFIDSERIKIKNKPHIFGDQRVLDGNDKFVCEVDSLLINATGITVTDVVRVVNRFGGICYPAHIDRYSNGIISVLGNLPTDVGFTLYELNDGSKIEEYSAKYDIPKERFIISSDAHSLEDMRDREHYFDLSDEMDSPDLVRAELFRLLRRL